MKNSSLVFGVLLSASLITLTSSSVVAAENKKGAASKAIATSPTKKWQQEPSSFMGLELIQPLSNSVNVECPKGYFGSVDSVKADSLAKLCHNDFILKDSGSYTIYGFKVDPLFREAYVKTLDGNLNGLLVKIQTNFNSGDFLQVKNIFIMKYGSPHKTEHEKLKTKGGAEFGNEVLTWVGDKIIIKIESLSSRGFSNGSIYEYGVVDVYTSDYLNKTSQERDSETKRSAAGL